jgi:excisionase family DNA binding protein
MDRLYTIPEVAERLRYGRTRVYELIREGRLPSVVVGPRARRVRESDLTAFIASLDDGGLSRRAQGLPEKIEDDAVLDAAAALLADPMAEWMRNRGGDARPAA